MEGEGRGRERRDEERDGGRRQERRERGGEIGERNKKNLTRYVKSYHSCYQLQPLLTFSKLKIMSSSQT